MDLGTKLGIGGASLTFLGTVVSEIGEEKIKAKVTEITKKVTETLLIKK